uniref:Col_cuticle_N domain-containing protein n=1 Tax=Brugia pahangi TaxID=6280 RepID=A0A0N4TXN9_BRUPA
MKKWKKKKEELTNEQIDIESMVDGWMDCFCVKPLIKILSVFWGKMERLKKFWNDIVGNEVDYSQFETRYGDLCVDEEQFHSSSQNGDTDIIVFREKSSKFMLFGTNIHVVLGATIAATIGLMVTITFCVIYTFYHQRGQGRNYFIDHLELGQNKSNYGSMKEKYFKFFVNIVFIFRSPLVIFI